MTDNIKNGTKNNQSDLCTYLTRNDMVLMFLSSVN